jgi:hypothetical protein
MVHDAGGCTIQPLISSHRSIVPEENFINDSVIFRPFTHHEDMRLLEHSIYLGNKWKLIGEEVGRSNIEVKHRVNFHTRLSMMKQPMMED